MRFPQLVASVAVSGVLLTQGGQPPSLLPPSAVEQLAASLSAAAAHARHVWRDTPPMNTDGTTNGYVEISRGDRRKWEFDMRANSRAIDRVIPEDIGGYPVNYGFVPQTVSYDGDPFDVLVLGPPIPGGELVRGAIVGLMHMEDEKGLDSKVVISPLGRDGRPLYELKQTDRDEMADYFRRYKRGEPGRFSKVPGWGSIPAGRAYVAMTHAFFRDCRRGTGACELVAAAIRATATETLRHGGHLFLEDKRGLHASAFPWLMITSALRDGRAAPSTSPIR